MYIVAPPIASLGGDLMERTGTNTLLFHKRWSISSLGGPIASLVGFLIIKLMEQEPTFSSHYSEKNETNSMKQVFSGWLLRTIFKYLAVVSTMANDTFWVDIMGVSS